MADESINPGLNTTEVREYERTYGGAAPRDEAIDLDVARRMFVESRARAYAESIGFLATDDAPNTRRNEHR
jgi:hypothetical protein